MGAGGKFQIDMCHGPLFGKVLLFSIPLMLSNIVQVLFNAIDLAVIGRFASHESMAAVGACGSLISLFLNFFFGLSAGANVVVARFIGARDGGRTARAVHTAMAVAFWGGILLGITGICTSKAALSAMGTPGNVLPKAVLYMNLYSAGIPFIMLYNYGSALLRAAGDTRRPLLFMLIAGSVKVSANLFFVILLKMDVAGVALATMVANILSAALIIRVLTASGDAGRLRIKQIRFHGESLTEILKIGVPAGIQSALFALSNVIIQSTINTFGGEAMAGTAAAASLEGIIYVAFNAYYYSTISFVGQNHGAKKYKRILRSIFYCMILSVATATLLGWGIYPFGEPLLGLYNHNPEVIAWGMLRLRYLATTYMLCAAMDIISGGLRGMGYSFTPMFVTLMGACAFRVAWVFWIFPLHPTMGNLLISYPVSWILVSLVNGFILYAVLRRLFRNVARRREYGRIVLHS